MTRRQALQRLRLTTRRAVREDLTDLRPLKARNRTNSTTKKRRNSTNSSSTTKKNSTTRMSSKMNSTKNSTKKMKTTTTRSSMSARSRAAGSSGRHMPPESHRPATPRRPRAAAEIVAALRAGSVRRQAVPASDRSSSVLSSCKGTDARSFRYWTTPPEKYSSTRLMTSAAVIMSMQRGSWCTTSTHS